MEKRSTTLAKKIIQENAKHRIRVMRVISDIEIQAVVNDDNVATWMRKKMATDIAEHVLPKLEIKTERDPFMDGQMFIGQLYVFSQTEFEDLVDDIECKVISALEPKLAWGDGPPLPQVIGKNE